MTTTQAQTSTESDTHVHKPTLEEKKQEMREMSKWSTLTSTVNSHKDVKAFPNFSVDWI